MKIIVGLRILFAAILVFMIGATIRTSLEVSIFEGGPLLLRQPWGVMTLYDAYFAFLTFYVWVAYKERSFVKRVLWFVAIMALGNITMALYMLLQLFRVPADGRVEDVLLRRST